MMRCPSCEGDLREQCEHSCSSCLGYGIRMKGLEQGGAIGICPVCFGTQLEPYWTDGERSIYNADCRTILPLVQAQVDLVLTDPPYDAEAHTKGRRQSVSGVVVARPIAFDALDPKERPIIGSLLVQQARGWVLVFSQIESAMLWRDSLLPAEYTRTQIWRKRDGAPQFTGDRPGMGYESIVTCWAGNGKRSWNGGGHHGFYDYLTVRNGTGHDTEKPIGLMQELARRFSNPGDIILDPFLGSGTTLRAAKDLGRRGLGIEIDLDYCKTAADRMAQSALPLAEPERVEQAALL